jgi:hypothetical protein
MTYKQVLRTPSEASQGGVWVPGAPGKLDLPRRRVHIHNNGTEWEGFERSELGGSGCYQKEDQENERS